MLFDGVSLFPESPMVPSFSLLSLVCSAAVLLAHLHCPLQYLLDRRIADIVKGVEVASALLISVVERVLVCVLRPYAKKGGCARFSSSQPSKILSEDS